MVLFRPLIALQSFDSRGEYPMKPSRFDSLPICSNLKIHPSINDLQWDLASKTHG